MLLRTIITEIFNLPVPFPRISHGEMLKHSNRTIFLHDAISGNAGKFIIDSDSNGDASVTSDVAKLYMSGCRSNHDSWGGGPLGPRIIDNPESTLQLPSVRSPRGRNRQREREREREFRSRRCLRRCDTWP